MTLVCVHLMIQLWSNSLEESPLGFPKHFVYSAFTDLEDKGRLPIQRELEQDLKITLSKTSI